MERIRNVVAAATRLSADQIKRLLDSGREDLVRAYRQSLTPLELFEPRPDETEEFDQQAAFIESKARFSICLGGTGSGKTEAAAIKTARYLNGTPPPRRRCPFWVIGDTFEQVCSVCWDEKLEKYIHPSQILSIDWYKQQRNWPFAVTLRHPDNPKEPGWEIAFKSYSQGRHHMQGRSIGGYWFNEEVPFDIVKEVQGRTREYGSPGWADFTPIEVRSPEWPDFYDDPPAGWQFFHLNVEKNQHLAPGWAEEYLAMFPEDERETRRIGVFASYVGQVFKEWKKPLHVITPQWRERGGQWPTLLGPDGELIVPRDWSRFRGIDFGFNNPFCCLWVAKDRDGRYYVYDEHYESQRLLAHHAAQIHKRYWDKSNPHCLKTYSDHQAQERHEMNQLGVYCTPANKRNLPARVSYLRSLMMVQKDGLPRLFVHERCVNLIKEIRGYHWPDEIGTGSRTRNPKDLPVDHANHAIDCLGYVCFSDFMGTSKAPQPVQRTLQPRASQRFNMGGGR